MFQSIETWPARMDLWGEWESILFDYADPEREVNARAFYEQHQREMHQ